MACAESLRVQAYFDGEVDALGAAEIERHLESCPSCRALLEELEQTRATLRGEAVLLRAPPELRARIERALDREEAPQVRPRLRGARFRPQPFWLGALGGIAGTAVAAALALLLFAPSLGSGLADELTAAHVRSLMPTHLLDVESTDRHTVKPWFAGHADVSPVVVDFSSEGYRLLGGRADYLEHERAAVLVYQHGAHVINVFSWAADGRARLPRATTRSGYRLLFWRSGDLNYCAVSDTGWDELEGLVRLLQAQSVHDAPP